MVTESLDALHVPLDVLPTTPSICDVCATSSVILGGARTSRELAADKLLYMVCRRRRLLTEVELFDLF